MTPLKSPKKFHDSVKPTRPRLSLVYDCSLITNFYYILGILDDDGREWMRIRRELDKNGQELDENRRRLGQRLDVYIIPVNNSYT